MSGDQTKTDQSIFHEICIPFCVCFILLWINKLLGIDGTYLPILFPIDTGAMVWSNHVDNSYDNSPKPETLSEQILGLLHANKRLCYFVMLPSMAGHKPRISAIIKPDRQKVIISCEKQNSYCYRHYLVTTQKLLATDWMEFVSTQLKYIP